MNTLSVRPDFVFETTEDFSVVESPPGSAIIQRRRTAREEKRTFAINMPHANTTEKDHVLAIWNQSLGAVLRFEFTPPDETVPIKCRFTGDSIAWKMLGAEEYALRFEIREA